MMDLVSKEGVVFASNFSKREGSIENYIQRKLVPAILLGGLLSQLGPIAQHEKEYTYRPFAELVKEHQTGKDDHSLLEPESLPGHLIEVTSGNTISGDPAATVKTYPWQYAYVLVNEDRAEEPHDYKTNAEDS